MISKNRIEFVISQNRGFMVKRHLIQFVFSTLWFSERKTNSAQTDFFYRNVGADRVEGAGENEGGRKEKEGGRKERMDGRKERGGGRNEKVAGRKEKSNGGSKETRGGRRAKRGVRKEKRGGRREKRPPVHNTPLECESRT